MTWLWNLRNSNRCLNVIVETISIPKCFYDQIFRSKFLVMLNDLSAIKSRNIVTMSPTNCDNFFFFLQNFNDSFGLFRVNHSRPFLPFSQLYLVIVESGTTKFDSDILNYIYANALFVYVITYESSTNLNFLKMENVLTGETLNLSAANRKDVVRYFGTYKNHPFFDSNYREKIFRVSLFKCAPYVVYLPDGTFDGIQYRLLREVAKDWKIEYIKCDFSSTITVPWNTVLSNVHDDISDLAMCSNWMSKPLSQYDTSTYFDLQCGTFLVPKPKILSPASYLYLSLNVNDWYGFIMSLVAMAFCFTVFTKIGLNLFGGWNDSVYEDFGRSMVDALDMATNHGLSKFPRENSMKLLVYRLDFSYYDVTRIDGLTFNSWLIVSFVVGIGYSTGYTSLLQKPVSLKPMDTLEQLIHSSKYLIVNVYQPKTLKMVNGDVSPVVS